MGNSNEYGNVTSSATYLATWSLAFCSLNIPLSITASVGNILILIALRGVTSLHPPTKLLFQCLAITDLGVGLTSQPLFSIYHLFYLTNSKRKSIIAILNVVRWDLTIIFCAVSMFTSTALSMDRLLALLLGLRYRHVVTLKRVRVVVFSFWLIAVLCVFMFLFWKKNIALATSTVLALLSVIISLLSYTIIFIRLRLHQGFVQHNAHREKPNRGVGIPFNVGRYKKTVASIALVQLAFVVCYVPFALVLVIALLNDGHITPTSFIFGSFATILVYLDSSLNPFLYYWRIKEVRQAVKATIRHLYCSCLSCSCFKPGRSINEETV